MGINGDIMVILISSSLMGINHIPTSVSIDGVDLTLPKALKASQSFLRHIRAWSNLGKKKWVQKFSKLS
jgi:hypothetical protein